MLEVYVAARLFVDMCKWWMCHDVSVQLQIEEITRRLQTGELGIPAIGERSVSLCDLQAAMFWCIIYCKFIVVGGIKWLVYKNPVLAIWCI